MSATQSIPDRSGATDNPSMKQAIGVSAVILTGTILGLAIVWTVLHFTDDNNSTTTVAESTTTTATTTDAAPAQQFASIRAEYADELADSTDCQNNSDTAMCLTIRDQIVRSIGKSIADLPASRSKSELGVTIDDWTNSMAKWREGTCYTNDSKSFDCLGVVPLDAYWRSIRMWLGVR